MDRTKLPYVEKSNSKSRLYAKKFGSFQNVIQHKTRKGQNLAPTTVYSLSKYFKVSYPKPAISLDYPKDFIARYKQFIQQTLSELKQGINLDLGIAVLLTMATNLRSGEIDQLYFKHLKMMFNREVIPIAIKRRHEFTYININKDLMEPYMPLLERYRPQKLVLCSISYINRMIKEHFPFDKNVRMIGLRLIRKVNSKLLLDVSNIETVKAFNRHLDADTTASYYLMGNDFQTI